MPILREVQNLLHQNVMQTKRGSPQAGANNEPVAVFPGHAS
jgi:hypothetical protein